MFELRNVQFVRSKGNDFVFKATPFTNYKEFARFESELTNDTDMQPSVYRTNKGVMIRIHQSLAINVELTRDQIYNVRVRAATIGTKDHEVPYNIAMIEIPENVESDVIRDDDDEEEGDSEKMSDKDDTAILDDYEVRELFDTLKTEIRGKLDKALNKLLDTENWLNGLDPTVANIEQLDRFNKQFEKDFLKK